jgi:hypothetical protein
VETELTTLHIDLIAGNVVNTHIDYIEEMIDKQAPIMQPLRLLCLFSLVNGGMKPKNYDFFRREIIQVSLNKILCRVDVLIYETHVDIRH